MKKKTIIFFNFLEFHFTAGFLFFKLKFSKFYFIKIISPYFPLQKKSKTNLNNEVSKLLKNSVFLFFKKNDIRVKMKFLS